MRAASLGMSAVMLAIFVAMCGVALSYPEGARFQPLVIGLPAIVLCVLQLVLDWRGRDEAVKAPAASPLEAADGNVSARRELLVWGYFLGLIGSVVLLGFWVAIPAFLIAFLRLEAEAGWPRALLLGLGATAALYGLFGVVLRVPLHPGFVWQMLASG